jgi:hypothetical protein
MPAWLCRSGLFAVLHWRRFLPRPNLAAGVMAGTLTLGSVTPLTFALSHQR